MGKFIVLDVVFYANSLNYDQGSGNIKELKKITKWDGKQYTLVSRYALRYSILHHANSLFGDTWPLAGASELNNNQGVVQAQGDSENLIKKFPEFDFFGYMMTETGQAANTRRAVASLSHAVSLVPFNYDSHFNANLDVARRSGNATSINPFTLEEHYSYYVYSIVIDLDRLGVIDGGKSVFTPDQGAERICQLLETVFTLNRQITGRREDLSPKLLVVGLYNEKPYKSFKDKIGLADEYEEEVTQKEETVEHGIKIIRRIVKTTKPSLSIDGLDNLETFTKENILTEVRKFAENTSKRPEAKILFYKDAGIRVAKGNEDV